MTATKPTTIDGKIFDKYSINFAVTGKYNADGTPNASVALRLIPTRIEDGIVEMSDEHAKAIVFGSMSQADSQAQTAFVAIAEALQEYLSAKGI